jgi:ATP-dependent exoDNAse (exonuclease V) beta subunit
MHEAKEEEEQKRLFYVAVTRAEEALILTGHWNSGGNSFLGFLTEGLGLQKQDDGIVVTDTDIKGLAILTEEDIGALYEQTRKIEAARTERRRVEVLPLTLPKRVPWKSVTDASEIRGRHGEDWLIIGDVLHRIFEGVSKGFLKENDLLTKASGLLASKGIAGDDLKRKNKVIENEIATLREKSIWQDIIMPRKDAFAELPFILEAGDSVYSGRIDRVIIENNVYNIYDYKTFPVKEREKEYLLREYSFQMNMYKNAVKKLFNAGNVQAFIIFTNIGEIYEAT